MNKQEAIEYFKNKEKGYLIKPSQINVSTTEVIHILNQIDEPQKPVIPQFVADWIEKCKVSGFYLRLAMDHWSMGEKLDKWMEYAENQEIFAKAWFYGYTVENQKLYTVEIPNPNGKGRNRFYLLKDVDTGRVMLCRGNFNPHKNKTLWLTESEIKENFEWAWQWAEPVEVVE